MKLSCKWKYSAEAQICHGGSCMLHKSFTCKCPNFVREVWPKDVLHVVQTHILNFSKPHCRCLALSFLQSVNHRMCMQSFRTILCSSLAQCMIGALFHACSATQMGRFFDGFWGQLGDTTGTIFWAPLNEILVQVAGHLWDPFLGTISRPENGGQMAPQ